MDGHPRYLDVMGVSFYHSDQREFPDQPPEVGGHASRSTLGTVPLTAGRGVRPLSTAAFVGETGYLGVGRAAWLREISAELWDAYGQGIPLEGVCLFPVVDRSDWNDTNHWHNSGLWDPTRLPDERCSECSTTNAEEVRPSQAFARTLRVGKRRPRGYDMKPMASTRASRSRS